MSSNTSLWLTALITVIAILSAPVSALWIQRKGDDERALKKRRENIFKTLWVNRRRPFYMARIDALNMIDVEFFGKEKVLDAWADLFAHYCVEHPEQNNAQIVKEREDKYALLLFEIGQVLGYSFGKTHIRDNVYRPVLHNEFDEIELETRRRVLHLLKSESLPVHFVRSGAVEKTNEQEVRFK